MYLIDTNVVSEGRKGKLANVGVRDFFRKRRVNKPVSIFRSSAWANCAEVLS